LQRNDPATKAKPAAAEAARLEAMNIPGLAVRIAAAAILRDVIAAGHSLDELFSARAVPSRLAGLDMRDRALARSIATVALRRLGTVRQALSALLVQGVPRSAAQIEWILIVAAAQILFLDVPDHAAVDLAVRITRLDAKSAGYAALVNGVLRNLIRERDTIVGRGDALDVDTPPWLAARWRKSFGEEAARAIARANRQEPTLDITVKSDADHWAAELGATVLPTGSLRLASHTPIPDLPGYAEGAWFVQDAAAALPARLIDVTTGMKIADLCSAPGGKAAQLAARGARVTAIDRSAERLKLLAANFARLHLEAEIVVADALTLKGHVFDAVLVDAPCTSTGTIRRHPDVAWTKKQSDIASLASLQARMLDKSFELVKPGGTIIYCVCSLEPEEGELQIPAFLRRNPDVMRQPITADEVGGAHEFITENGDLRTLPSHLAHSDSRFSGVDGFFAARLIRRT
jgi:16S rRNA (cytosine967-C5)-methyltransferase